MTRERYYSNRKSTTIPISQTTFQLKIKDNDGARRQVEEQQDTPIFNKTSTRWTRGNLEISNLLFTLHFLIS
jgi:hypothetical protein